MLPVRVVFKKNGVSAYISHLDLQRTVFRSLVRSGVGPQYTEGFNPHIKLTFASPLSVYQESEFEVFDFFAEDGQPYEEITEKLRAAFPDCLPIVRAVCPECKLGDLALADYDVFFETSLDAKAIEEALSGEITVLKKSKKGDRSEDISGLIKEKSFEDAGNGVRMRLRASCGSGEHLNVKYISDFLGDRITDCRIRRLSLLLADGTPIA